MRTDLRIRLEKVIRDCDKVAFQFHASAMLGFIATATQLYAIKFADTNGEIGLSCGLYLMFAFIWLHDLRSLNYALHEIHQIRSQARDLLRQ